MADESVRSRGRRMTLPQSMRMFMSLLWAAVAGCAEHEGQFNAPTPLRPVGVSAMAAQAQGGARVPDKSGLQSIIRAALADAAQRSGIDPALLKVTSAERVTWSDGSLGCPEPGRLYTQALVPGYRIRIQASGETLHYHAGTRGAPRLCPPGRASDPVVDDSRT